MLNKGIKLLVSHNEMSDYCIRERIKWLNVVTEYQLQKKLKETLKLNPESNQGLCFYIDFLNNDKTFSPQLIDGFKQLINTSQYSILRFCPSCIKDGIHHFYQQNYCFKNCLIHGDELISKCPKEGCRMSINYELKSAAKQHNHSFCCENGHCLLDESSKSHLIKTWKSEKPLGLNVKQYDYNNVKEKWFAFPNDEGFYKFNQKTLFRLLSDIKMNKEYKLLKNIELSRIDTMDSFIPNIIKKDLDLMHKLCINNVSNLIIETILSSNNIKYREKLFDIILHPNDRETNAQNIIDIPNFNYMFKNY